MEGGCVDDEAGGAPFPFPLGGSTAGVVGG